MTAVPRRARLIAVADVAVTDPCGEADQSIITVRYATDTAREAIDDVLSENVGFGVAVEVVRD